MVLVLVLTALIAAALLSLMVLALMMVLVVAPTVLRRWPSTEAEQRVSATSKTLVSLGESRPDGRGRTRGMAFAGSEAGTRLPRSATRPPASRAFNSL